MINKQHRQEESNMAGKGPKTSSQRSKTSKALRSGNKQKRFKNTNEAQAAYHAKIKARRDKKAKLNK